MYEKYKNMEFKDILKTLRKEKGVKQTDVANAIHVSPATIGNYEQGTRLPRNEKIYLLLARYFQVDVNVFKEHNHTALPRPKSIYHDDRTSYDAITTPILRKYDWNHQYREDIPIIYNGQDITSLIKLERSSIESETVEQRKAYLEFFTYGSRAIYARKNLIGILEKIKNMPLEETKDSSTDINALSQEIHRLIVTYYDECWAGIAEVFPKASDMSSLFDLLEKCINTDRIAAIEFFLINLDYDYDWLREKLHL